MPNYLFIILYDYSHFHLDLMIPIIYSTIQPAFVEYCFHVGYIDDDVEDFCCHLKDAKELMPIGSWLYRGVPEDSVPPSYMSYIAIPCKMPSEVPVHDTEA